MRLSITTPLRTVVQADGVIAVRAEDETGLFGIEHGHAALLTVLVPSIVSWRDEAGLHHAAVRGGLLTLRGDHVEIATREAVVSDDLDQLQPEVVRSFRSAQQEEERSASHAARLEAEAVRRITQALRPNAQVRRLGSDDG
ncbi:MAG: F0F1 ATP synthase subunit epsilon [Alphaproteobacteria bacterium]|nr:F0F1 ATP synthase subunit epsilon [Alphaproteobacteria bacterium]